MVYCQYRWLSKRSPTFPKANCSSWRDFSSVVLLLSTTLWDHTRRSDTWGDVGWFLKVDGLILTFVLCRHYNKGEELHRIYGQQAVSSIGLGNEKPFNQSYGLDYRQVIDSSKSSSAETEEKDWLGEHQYFYLQMAVISLERLIICSNLVINFLLIAELPKLILKMAGEPELTGLAKHFNSVTFTGRANVAKVGRSC